MLPEDLRTEVHQFIQKNFIFDETKTISDDQSLLGSGVIDSTGILELISFLEELCQLKFEDHELIADNFDTVGKITSFTFQKISQPRTSSHASA